MRVRSERVCARCLPENAARLCSPAARSAALGGRVSGGMWMMHAQALAGPSLRSAAACASLPCSPVSSRHVRPRPRSGSPHPALRPRCCCSRSATALPPLLPPLCRPPATALSASPTSCACTLVRAGAVFSVLSAHSCPKASITACSCPSAAPASRRPLRRRHVCVLRPCLLLWHRRGMSPQYGRALQRALHSQREQQARQGAGNQPDGQRSSPAAPATAAKGFASTLQRAARRRRLLRLT